MSNKHNHYKKNNQNAELNQTKEEYEDEGGDVPELVETNKSKKHTYPERSASLNSKRKNNDFHQSGFLTKQNIIVVVSVVIILFSIFMFLRKDQKQNIDVFQQQHEKSVQKSGNPQYKNEIEDDAIETYLYLSTVQAYQLAQSAESDSKEYRDYEQKYAEYRVFRDNRMKKLLEQKIR